MKEIGSEMRRFQARYEESRQLIITLRKNFLKELSHLKSLDNITTGGGGSSKHGR